MKSVIVRYNTCEGDNDFEDEILTVKQAAECLKILVNIDLRIRKAIDREREAIILKWRKPPILRRRVNL